MLFLRVGVPPTFFATIDLSDRQLRTLVLQLLTKHGSLLGLVSFSEHLLILVRLFIEDPASVSRQDRLGQPLDLVVTQLPVDAPCRSVLNRLIFRRHSLAEVAPC